MQTTSTTHPYGQKIDPSKFPDQRQQKPQFNPNQATAAHGEHNPSTLPLNVVAWVEHWVQAFGIF